MKRAIANIHPTQEERYWQIFFIKIWMNYASYEELDAHDIERTRHVYRECLQFIRHNQFSFAKIWLLTAQFETRQLNLTGARPIPGQAVGKAPKDNFLRKYIEFELQLGNIDWWRKMSRKYLECLSENFYAWSIYAELERSLREKDREKSIFELAIAQPAPGMPELLWKAYINFEILEETKNNSRWLYERLLERTEHLKVRISYARRVFESAINYFRESTPDLKEERAMLEEWLNLESSFGKLEDGSLVLV